MDDKRSSPARSILTIIAVVLVPALVWASTLAYHHIRLRSAIRACERDMIASKDPDDLPDFPKDRVRVISAAGCRAVPDILDSVEEARNEQYIKGCAVLLMNVVRRGRTQNNPEGPRLCGAVYVIDDPAFRADCITHARDWWRTHAAEQHPWWKVWSRTCLAD
jgi:hypothetical protein